MKNSLVLWAILVATMCNAQVTDIAQDLDLFARDIPLVYSPRVSEIIYEFANNDRTKRTLVDFEKNQLPLRSFFIENGVPDELSYLVLAAQLSESRLTNRKGPFALSNIAARENGLEVSKYIDERYDVVKSAKVFATVINNKRALSQNWGTALLHHFSSQNAHSLDTSSFEEVLAQQSYKIRWQYDNFVAALYVAKRSKELDLQTKDTAERVVNVAITQYTTLYQLASQLGVSFEAMQTLNPTYVLNIIPNDGRDHFLTIPASKMSKYNALGDELYTYVKTPTFTRTELKVIEVFVPDTTNSAIASQVIFNEDLNKDEVYYSVRNGDILTKIADMFDCEVVQIVRWNGIQKDKIDTNQKLIIKVAPEKRAFYQSIDRMSNAQRAAIIKQD